jgi:uncharacterized protein YuzE
LHDLSLEGCKVEFVDRPRLDETVWIKIDGLERLPGTICWVEGNVAGVEFERPLHPAVLDNLLTRLT